MHIPCLCAEVAANLECDAGDVVLDCTVNGGGHAEAVLHKISPGGFLIGIDQDRDALNAAEERLKAFDGSFKLAKENFRNLDKVLGDLNIREVDGMLFDLGLSSLQLENANRGFSIKLDAPLDMRMDLDGVITAYDIVNRESENSLDRILRDYGQESWHKKLARTIVSRRREQPIRTTRELAQLVEGVVKRVSGVRIHPATRTFQALRIAVNQELTALDEALTKAANFLKKGARICVLSYHSLEDRIVKQKFKAFAAAGEFQVLTKKPMRPTVEEVTANPRCRSARLRAARRI